jgi:hypothetical protein
MSWQVAIVDYSGWCAAVRAVHCCHLLLLLLLLLLLISRAQHSPELLVDLQNQQQRAWAYSSSTTIRQSVVHLASLQLLGTLLPQQAPDKAAALLLRLVPQYIVHPSSKCRGQFQELLVNTWQRFAADGVAAPAAGSKEVQAGSREQQVQQLEEALFFLLADKDGGVYQAVLQYWQDVLPKRLEERLQVRAGSLSPTGKQQTGTWQGGEELLLGSGL